jgi:hypothetical protein
MPAIGCGIDDIVIPDLVSDRRGPKDESVGNPCLDDDDIRVPTGLSSARSASMPMSRCVKDTSSGTGRSVCPDHAKARVKPAAGPRGILNNLQQKPIEFYTCSTQGSLQ